MQLGSPNKHWESVETRMGLAGRSATHTDAYPGPGPRSTHRTDLLMYTMQARLVCGEAR